MQSRKNFLFFYGKSFYKREINFMESKIVVLLHSTDTLEWGLVNGKQKKSGKFFNENNIRFMMINIGEIFHKTDIEK